MKMEAKLSAQHLLNNGTCMWTVVHICGLWSTFVDFDPQLWKVVHNCELWLI